MEKNITEQIRGMTTLLAFLKKHLPENVYQQIVDVLKTEKIK